MTTSDSSNNPRFSPTLIVADDGWRLVESGWDADRAVAVGSNFMVGNGYLGYRGTNPQQSADGYVALVVTDTYDCADGHWRELTTAPNPLFVSITVAGRELRIDEAVSVETSLDLRGGVFGQRCEFDTPDGRVNVAVERLASYAELHLLAQRVTVSGESTTTVQVDAGIDGDIWSLNGTHLPAVDYSADGETLSAAGRTVESGIDLAVAAVVTGPADPTAVIADSGALQRSEAQIGPGRTVVIETIATVTSSSDGPGALERAREVSGRHAARGFDGASEASRADWDTFWQANDITVEGDVLDDASLRFSTYHNRICTPAHANHLPIGARGLSCQAYQGSAFWDQEIYNLPAFLYTDPSAARNLLIYRHGTLDGARRKAARLGYDGAYYAWVSGVTGDELCPDIFFEDVLTGRPIRNHFNVWQMHVAPDVVTTVKRYVEVTGDDEFLVSYGAEIAFEVARFLRSFVRYDDWRGIYHCIRLLGPDEWHENVDNNAFTNFQTHAALSFAIETYERLGTSHRDELDQLSTSLGLTAEEVDRWRHVRDNLYLPAPDPDSHLIEQFDGFFQLEDVSPAKVAERLIDPSEYWGWPNGVAVATQVSKQADVTMLLWLHEHAFDDELSAANYDYYEPRCSHQSSLSHAAYGMVAARLGRADDALEHLRSTARVDLLNTNHAVVAGTFIGGIHTAACGGSNQLAVQGIGGLGFANGSLTIDPALPAAWSSLRYPVRFRDQDLVVEVSAERVMLTARSTNAAPVSVIVRGTPMSVEPGATQVV